MNWARDDPRPGAKKQRTRETQQQASGVFLVGVADEEPMMNQEKNG